MLSVHAFKFNDFEVNTYIVENGHEALIIDPAMYKEGEWETMFTFLTKRKIRPIGILITHPHLDHLMGVEVLTKRYFLPVYMHPTGEYLYKKAPLWGTIFGVPLAELPPFTPLKEGNHSIGAFSFKAILTPGHADGSLCYYFEDIGALFTGDVLFEGSVGRTDLETGNYTTLMGSLKKLYKTLPLETVIYPGHGNKSTLQNELETNPFLREMH